MDVSPIIDPLNDAQREAVTAPAGHVLVLAGAGSGKTRVLVHRIAWLIQVERVSPFGILAVTFTNKAAREMRGRIEELMGVPARGMWVGTFHGLAHRLLRAHWQEAGLPETFQIIDSDDQLRLVKRVLRQLELDEARFPPKQLQWFINGRKDEGLRPQHVEHFDDPFLKTQIRVYAAYDELCQRLGLVDFAEILLRAHELWLKYPRVLAHYQQRFGHILVDEFQDTNSIQYAWLRLLAGQTGRVFAVGDDDQSIYGWRGARIENIQRFSEDFPGTQLVRLEQNYRSTGTILAAANALIAHNAGRMGKNLWTEGEDGEPIELYNAYNEYEEAQYVVDRIEQFTETGQARSEIAILYRSNAQSRVFEEQLMQRAIPYRVYGGLRFFERAEIKDALCYLRLANNRGDDASFERVVNQPPRGIGERTVGAVREQARALDISLWESARRIVAEKALNARAVNALNNFIELIENAGESIVDLELHEQAEAMIQASGLIEHFKKEKGERGQARIENLEELVNAARAFEVPEEAEEDLTEGEPDALTAFLAHAALEAGEGQADAWEDCVQLMTLHSAKGLEFPVVFMAGLEEGLFPHQMSADEPGRLEEERRLCYVGMTRARQRLHVSYAEKRRLHGQENYAIPSRFLRELPQGLLQEVRPQPSYGGFGGGPGAAAPTASSNLFADAAADAELALGSRVQHPKFGEGVVLNYEGNGPHARVQVNFQEAGPKWLVVAYANLAPA
ncbi:DNA helicase II [Thiohalobacter thiocyanaticus]|uniref:DNA 3'-5' helicase n=1 Tax=Thiohalobacter thiocyanaticus TaxID=585455 RepID=A0A1Z4VMD0_9GAMM|nr:DNA helicase II [Thiohalobacter thiocyanaticus]BAZ92508.1 DNA helicase II [Thiohalobacter thiocyanaticus]